LQYGFPKERFSDNVFKITFETVKFSDFYQKIKHPEAVVAVVVVLVDQEVVVVVQEVAGVVQEIVIVMDQAGINLTSPGFN
jgi:hypothetical protein